MLPARSHESKQTTDAKRKVLAAEPLREQHPGLSNHRGVDLPAVAISGGPRGPAHHLQMLQRTIGNQAALSMLSRAAPAILPEFVVNKAGDQYEQEADRVAERVMRMPESVPRTSSSGSSVLQRKCAECTEEEEKNNALARKESGASDSVAGSAAPPIVHEVLRSPGQPLDAATRAFFEPRFGHDFSNVRIHTDGQAAASARAVNALAYTAGQHVVFEARAYRHETDAGRKLLAHELTHTIQQSSHPVVTGSGATALQRAPADEQGPALPELPDPNPALSPRYIDNVFDSVSPPGMLTGATTFHWREGGAKKKITIALKDFTQNDGLVFVALLKVHKSKDEALKTVNLYAKATPGFAYYSFYFGPDGVIMPTSFSIASTPKFHALWPDLKRLNAEAAAEITRGLRPVANAINPFPCTEVDEKGNLTASINFSNCALPVFLHAYAIRSGGHAPEASDRQRETRPPETAVHETDTKAQPAVKDDTALKQPEPETGSKTAGTAAEPKPGGSGDLLIEVTNEQAERLAQAERAKKWTDLPGNVRTSLGKRYNYIIQTLTRKIAAGGRASKVLHYPKVDAKLISELAKDGGRVVITEGRLKGGELRFDIAEIDFSRRKVEVIDLTAMRDPSHAAVTGDYAKELHNLTGFDVEAFEMPYVGEDMKLLDELERILVPDASKSSK
jgi:hypothetical protein